MNTTVTTPSGFVIFTKTDVERSIVVRFEDMVAQFPNRPAVCKDGKLVTYDALNRMTNRMARATMKATASSGASRVLILLEKNISYIAAILAVLKSGHAYVPLDPAFPRSRNEYIVEDSQAALILTNDAHMEMAQQLGGQHTPILNLDRLDADLSDDNPGLNIAPDAIAYLIYTSGSTGRPKGVIQSHRNVLHGCMRRTNLQRISPEDRMTLFYSCSVMGSVYCIFGALLNGASLFPYDIREEGLTDLSVWLENNRITVYHSVASVFRQFATTYEGSTRFSDIRLVIFGGERVLVSDVELVRSVFSTRCELFTGLGSTETGTIRHFIITPDVQLKGKVVPIGYSVEGMEIVLRDEDGNEVEAGRVGEITVRSKYNALGYWNQVEATQRVFIQDPQDSGLTSYHTGDMGFLNADGLLEHRGRKDFQVKIRGFRVEIGEVETSLLDHPGVREAVVVAKEVNDENQLVAYLIPNRDEQVVVRQLRSFLRNKLPYYMVPTTFVQLDAIPRTPNNKVDRNALPEPTRDNAMLEDEIVRAETDTEKRLAEIWKEVLGKDEMGTNQNFFDLGGHSLSATRLVSRIVEAFGVRVSMKTIFEAEDLRALARAIENASQERGSDEVLPLIRVPREKPLPLSFAQRRMWLLDQLFPGSSAYNISNTVRLEGDLDVPALEQSLNEMVRRHEVLRTLFASDDAGPRQVILPFAPTELPQYDITGLSAEDREARADRLVREHVQKSFNLERGPLFEKALVRLDEAEHILILVFNHIIYDNIWSSGIFFRELGQLYSAHRKGEEASLPHLSVQFADYAHWQQEFARRRSTERQMTYWREQLADLPSPLELPSDHTRPADPTFRGGRVAFAIPASVKASLVDLGRQEVATPFMILLTAWQVLLHRYTQQNDILVGTPTGRRERLETEGLLGLFINTLVLRADCSGNPSFRELLKCVRRTTIDAFTHDDVPFEDLLAELKLGRDVGMSPLFQTLFIHRNAASSPWNLPGLKVTPLDIHSGGSKFDLTLSVLEDAQCMKGTIEYSADLFNVDSIERMAGNYKALLSTISDNPDASIWDLELLSPNERQLVTVTWNPAASEYPRDHCVHQLIEEQAVLRPNETALVFEGATMTYKELNSRANRLATYLEQRGVGPDVLVALCVERSFDLVIGLLGILKAGGAYVPLDPYFPSERLAYMIKDSNAPVFLTQSSISKRFPDLDASRILIDDDWPDIQEESDENPGIAAPPSALAYVIYTSGSTGKPKGVQITQQALVNFLCSMQREPGLRADDVLHAVTTISFDIAGLEIFLPLITGARVVIASRETSMDPSLLIQSLKNHNASIMQATPVTWRMLLDSGWDSKTRLKILCGGEAMGTDLAARLLKTGFEVWNLYGPTETTIWSSVARVRSPENATIIGSPIANTEFQILSPRLTPQPLGVPGELLIGGDGLARGYLNRDELTTEKFIPHPFSSGARLYRTGDLVRRRADGAIEFLGRMDNQVKLRGFRIELGEIENRLKGLHELNHVVVVVREDDPGDKRLVAYYSTHDGNGMNPKRFSALLKDQLPEYMIPSAFVHLEKFPLTPNNKVDRKSLPKPAFHTTDMGAVEESDRRLRFRFPWMRKRKERRISAFERGPNGSRKISIEALVGLWQEVLGTSQIGEDDNFFDLGGHSLLAVTLANKIKKRFGIKIPLAALLKAPTPRKNLEFITNSNQETAANTLVSVAGQDSPATPVFLFHSHGGNVLEYYRLATLLGHERPVYALQCAGVDGSPLVTASIEELAQSYLAEIRAVQPNGPYYFGGYCFGGILGLEAARQLREVGQEAELVFMINSGTSTYSRQQRKSISTIARLVDRVIYRLALEWSGFAGKSLKGKFYRLRERLRRIGELAVVKFENFADAQFPHMRKRERQRSMAYHLEQLTKNNDTAWTRYRPNPYDGNVLFFRATRQRRGRVSDPLLGWKNYLKGPLTLHCLPGFRQFLLDDPVVVTIAETISRELSTQDSTGPGADSQVVREFSNRG